MRKPLSNNIRAARKANGLTLKELGREIGVSESTVSQYETGKRQPDNEMLLRLAEALETTVSYLLSETEERKPLRVVGAVFSAAEIEHIKKFRTLDERGKSLVNTVLEHEAQQIAPPKRTKIIPLLGDSFAAGTAEPSFGNPWTDYETDDSRAEFAIRVNGASMSPYLQDGEIALGAKRTPEDGEIGAFLLDGGFLVKQVCQDSEGNVYLFSLNREYKDIKVSKEQNLMCFGTILIKKMPLPRGLNT